MGICFVGVAPFAGAWIEMMNSSGEAVLIGVAPFAGAWIEIRSYLSISLKVMSLPSRERGLKYTRMGPGEVLGHVAPFAGAWIEMHHPTFTDF